MKSSIWESCKSEVKQLVYSHVYLSIILGLLAVLLCAFGGWIAAPKGIVKQLLVGVMNTAIGAIVVTLGVKLILKARKKKYRKPIRDYALMLVHIELNNIVELIGEMAEDSAPKSWNNHPQSIESLLSEEIAEQICMHLDPMGDSPSASDDTEWVVYIRDKIQEVEDNLDKLVMKYGEFLPVEVLLPLEGAKESNFLYLSKDIANLVESRGEELTCLGPGLKELLEEYFDTLKSLIRGFNSKFKEYDVFDTYDIDPIGLPDNLARDDLPSRVGENRIEPEWGDKMTKRKIPEVLSAHQIAPQ